MPPTFRRTQLLIGVSFCCLLFCISSVEARNLSHGKIAGKAKHPVQRIALQRRGAPARFTVPILMYHYIRDNVSLQDKLGIGLSVSRANLDHQLAALEANGYTSVTFSDLAAGKLPQKPVMITFDDGYEDAYTDALPVLKAHQMKAVFYIITGFIGKPGYLSWDQIRALKAEGMEIGAHTVDHHDLANQSADRQKHEVGDSVHTLEKALSGAILSLAYPSGRYTTLTMNYVKKAGVPYAVTTQGGIASDLYDQHELPRLRMRNDTDILKIIDSYAHQKLHIHLSYL